MSFECVQNVTNLLKIVLSSGLVGSEENVHYLWQGQPEQAFDGQQPGSSSS